MSESRFTVPADLDAGVLKGESVVKRFHGTTVRARWLRYGIPLCLIVLALLVYMPALDAGFSRWDDDDLVHRQFDHLTLTMDNLAWMFSTTFSGHYQPLTWISYAVDQSWSSLDPFAYHLTNVLLHIMTMCAFYFLARRLLAIGTDHRCTFDSAPVMLSGAFAAFVFGIHPLRAESVAWIAERRDVLSGFFYVVAVACYVRYAASLTGGLAPHEEARVASVGRRYYVASVGLCLLSLLSKASAMTIPFVLLILDVFPLHRFKHDRWQRGGRARVWLDKIPFLVLALVAGVMALAAQSSSGDMYSLAEHDIPARFAQVCYGLVFYLWKTVWPVGLGPLYEIPTHEILVGRLLWASLPVALVLTIVTVWQSRKWPAVATALVYYVLVVTPVLGLVQTGPQLVADRYSYLSCLGLAVLAGAALLGAMQRTSTSRRSGRRAGILLAVGLVVAALAKSTMNQVGYWQTPLTLWSRGVIVSPNSAIAMVNYADALMKLGTPPGDELAEGFYGRALEIDPDDAVGLHHYADLLNRSGRTDQAIRHYIRSLAIDPTRHRACLSLGRALVDAGRPDLALEVLRDGARRNPEAFDLCDYLARLLATHPDEEIRNGEEALALAQKVYEARRQPHLDSMTTLAYALAEVGKFDLAVAMGRQVVQIAESRGLQSKAMTMQSRVDLFQRGEAYHGGP